MKTRLKKAQWFTVTIILCLVVTLFVAGSCDKSDILPKTDNNVSFTPCQQNKLRSSEFSNKVDVEFTGKGVQITHYDFEVPCDFTTVDVSHTLVNGVLNITQQGSPSKADCICYTDVSYTLHGISQEEVNVIFINGVQVYCYNENYPKKVLFTEYSLAETSCKWKKIQGNCNNNNNAIVTINSREELENYIECTGGVDYVDIDFFKFTLLLVRGVECYSVTPNYIDLQQLSAQSYEIKINLQPNWAAVVTHWQIPIIVSKIIDDSVIELIVSKNT